MCVKYPFSFNLQEHLIFGLSFTRLDVENAGKEGFVAVVVTAAAV